MQLLQSARAVAFALLLVPGLSIVGVPTPVAAQTAEGGMCLEFSNDGTGYRNTCSYNLLIKWCVIRPDFPRTKEGKYHYGQSNCGKEESTGTLLRAGESRSENPRSRLTGGGIVWLECRPSNGMMTFNTMKTGHLIVGPPPRFQPTCMRGDGQIVAGFTGRRQLSASASRGDLAGNDVAALSPTAVAAPTGLTGLWTGRSSGNQVTIEMRPGGFVILVTGQRREGQYGDGQFFRDAGSGLYLFTKPDGNNVKAQVIGPDSLRVTNPDGWTDVFERPSTVVANSTPFGGSNGAGSTAPQGSSPQWPDQAAAPAGGSLPPLSTGGPAIKNVQEGEDARVIASDGRSAMDCVKLVTLASADSSTSGGGRVLSNQCGGPVEITWCYTDSECSNGLGAMWTVGTGRSWPVSAERDIRWAACHGANTVSFVKGSAGLQYICRAPAN